MTVLNTEQVEKTPTPEEELQKYYTSHRHYGFMIPVIHNLLKDQLVYNLSNFESQIPYLNSPTLVANCVTVLKDYYAVVKYFLLSMEQINNKFNLGFANYLISTKGLNESINEDIKALQLKAEQFNYNSVTTQPNYFNIRMNCIETNLTSMVNQIDYIITEYAKDILKEEFESFSIIFNEYVVDMKFIFPNFSYKIFENSRDGIPNDVPDTKKYREQQIQAHKKATQLPPVSLSSSPEESICPLWFSNLFSSPKKDEKIEILTTTTLSSTFNKSIGNEVQEEEGVCSKFLKMFFSTSSSSKPAGITVAASTQTNEVTTITPPSSTEDSNSKTLSSSTSDSPPVSPKTFCC